MSKIQVDRKVEQTCCNRMICEECGASVVCGSQQDEQTITVDELAAALGWPGGISTPVLNKKELLRMVSRSVHAQHNTDRPAYYDNEGGSMCNGIGRDYF